VTGQHVTSAARAGDAFACSLLAGFAQRLGAGLARVSTILDPEVIVIGGGLPADGDLFLPLMEPAVVRDLPRDRVPPGIRLAELGVEGGLIGAAALAAAAITDRRGARWLRRRAN
jgi:glucokinase